MPTARNAASARRASSCRCSRCTAAGEAPDRAAVNEALAGNLCRCTGYRPIVDAGACRVSRPAPTDSTADAGDGGAAAGARYRRDAGAAYAGTVLAPRTVDELAERSARQPGRGSAGRRHRCRAVGDQAAPGAAVHRCARRVDRAAPRRADRWRDQDRRGATYEDALPVLADYWPDFGGLIRRLGSRQVRNRGTIGGNIANASPIGDTPPVLLALDATLVLRRGDAMRSVPLAEILPRLSPTVLAPGEFIERIDVPLPAARQRVPRLQGVASASTRTSPPCAAHSASSWTAAGCATYPHRLRRHGGDAGAGASGRAGAGRAALDARRPCARRWPAGRRFRADLPICARRAAYRRLVARNLLLKFFLETERRRRRAHPTRLAVPA